MKIISINTVAFGSTGRIAKILKKDSIKNGYEYKNVVGRGKILEGDYLINKSSFGLSLSAFLSRLSGNHENYNHIQTFKLIKWLKKERPDIIHLHNLHGNYINIKMLIKYINKYDIPIVWTFHDSWPITGQCTHFDSVMCNKWKSECRHCPLLDNYPKSWFFDRSKHKFHKKKKLFNSIKHLVIVTPSMWLNDIVRESFLSKKKSVVINNGINLETFKPTSSDVRERYGIGDRFMILGVAGAWSNLKGLDAYSVLADRLDSSKYCVVLVGIQDNVISDKIIALPPIHDLKVLADLYSSADVMVNLTIADTFPTVNIEALSCGTPVITYATGGCPEQVNEKCGIVVNKGDLNGVIKLIENFDKSKYHLDDCLKQAKKFEEKYMTKKYIELYDKIISDEGELK